ncbi:hypothetical protein O181_037362 [Austropuccinia psidii MF-1]|uniref:Uncharacterized protein n=1 Tax=Austropuccinia psidii MF-1 TaxID=1389203 RepID=A0A9Q3D8U9_9BASI|nr:hypothetical protein [Austropuccinia psidii MF-1]
MLVPCPTLPTTWPEEFPPKTPLWLTMMKVFPSRNGPQDPKQADGNNSGGLALSPQALICPPPLLGHHPMVTSLLDQRKVIIRPMKDGDEQKPPNSPQKDSPIQCMPREQTPRQPTPGPSATQWSEYLLGKPSQHDEPPIPGLSPSSKPPEDVPTSCPATPRSIIIIDDTPIRSHPPISPSLTSPPSTPTLDLPPISPESSTTSSPLVPSSSHSYDDAFQEFIDLRPTLMIPRAINQILLEHSRLLHMIPFVDAPGITGGTKLPPWPGTGGLSKGGHHQDSLQILRKKL